MRALDNEQLTGVKAGSLVLPVPPAGWVQKPAGISLCMIVKNEEQFLDRCLRSVAGSVDEINIVDTGSSDATIAIAQRHGARVERRDWRNDFAWARNEALALASRRWVLVLDADEELEPGAAEHLRTLRDMQAYLHGLWIRCRNDEGGGAAGQGLVNAIIRIFPNHPRLRYRNAIHEFVALDGHPNGMSAADSPIAIVHHGYTRQVMIERDKPARNWAICSAEAERRPDDPFAWYNLGMAAMLSGRTADACTALERMRALTRGLRAGYLPHGLSGLADIYLTGGQPQTALEVARECLALAPTFANAHFTAGKALAHLGRLAEARDAFAAAIAAGEHAAEHFVVDRDVSEWKAHNELGATLLLEGGDELALAWFELGLQNRPGAQPLQLNRARALERLGRFAEAEAALAAIYRASADSLSAIEYINFLLRRGALEPALGIIDQAAAFLPWETKATLLGTAALLLLRSEGPSSARTRLYFRRAAESHPDAAGLVRVLYAQLGDAAAAALLAEVEAECGSQRRASGLRLSAALA